MYKKNKLIEISQNASPSEERLFDRPFILEVLPRVLKSKDHVFQCTWRSIVNGLQHQIR